MLKKMFKKKKHFEYIVSPVDGLLVPIEKVNDPTFANKSLGDGVAIKPLNDVIVAPVDSKVVMVSNTKHAIGLETSGGMQIILHVGINTVKLKGVGFEIVNENEYVKSGDPLIIFDRKEFEEQGIDTTVLLILVDNKEYEIINIEKEGEVSNGQSEVAKFIKKQV